MARPSFSFPSLYKGKLIKKRIKSSYYTLCRDACVQLKTCGQRIAEKKCSAAALRELNFFRRIFSKIFTASKPSVHVITGNSQSPPGIFFQPHITVRNIQLNRTSRYLSQQFLRYKKLKRYKIFVKRIQSKTFLRFMLEENSFKN